MFHFFSQKTPQIQFQLDQANFNSNKTELSTLTYSIRAMELSKAIKNKEKYEKTKKQGAHEDIQQG